MKLTDYRTIVFDCDGVILDSNRLKTEGFRAVARPIDAELAEELVRHHVENGGVSRYRKFDFFIDRCREEGIAVPTNKELCQRFGAHVREGLLECPVAGRLADLRAATRVSTWMVASGADQSELRDIFEIRGLAPMFGGGIFGSPTSKRDILRNAFESQAAPRPALMLGDSREDYIAAHGAGIDFMFVSAWSEFEDLHEFALHNDIPVLTRLSDLVGDHASER